jgi:hypothetical protein
MTLNIILVTGVSAGESRQPDLEFLQGYYPEANVELFDPEQYMESNLAGRLSDKIDLAGRAYDVLAYAGPLRKEVDTHFCQMVEKYKPALVVAHSLGTVIAARNISQGLSIPKVILMNSPLWIPGYSQLQGIKTPCDWPHVTAFYSSKDWISKQPLNANKFKLAAQQDLRTSHSFEESWEAAWSRYRNSLSLDIRKAS